LLEQNRDYQGLLELKRTVEAIEDLKTSVASLRERAERVRSVTFDPKFPHFPYGALRNSIEANARKSLLKESVRLLYVLLSLAVWLAWPIGVLYLLDAFDVYGYGPFFDDLPHQVGLGVFYALLLAVAVYFLPKAFRAYGGGIVRRRLKRAYRRHKEQLAEAYNDSKAKIGDYQEILDGRLEEFEAKIKEQKREIHRKRAYIKEKELVHPDYIDAIPSLIRLFEVRRAESVKEAMNLYEFERRLAERFDRVQTSLEANRELLKALLEDSRAAHNYERTKDEKQRREAEEAARKESKARREAEREPTKKDRRQARKAKKQERKKRYG